jgi:hypothetical protein
VATNGECVDSDVAQDASPTSCIHDSLAWLHDGLMAGAVSSCRPVALSSAVELLSPFFGHPPQNCTVHWCSEAVNLSKK